jgi:GT2 family glycosyltransferase
MRLAYVDTMRLRIAVVVATHGRGDLLRHLLHRLQLQYRAPDIVCISGVDESDVQGARRVSGLPLRIVFGPMGLTAQRNTGVRCVIGEADAVVFFDDDFLPSRTWLQRLEVVLDQHPQILGIMGNTLADGGSCASIDLAHAERLICEYDTGTAQPTNEVAPIAKLYGCNMAYRASLFGRLQFDEGLPLHGWLEDSDFSYRVRALGPIATARDLWGVHLGWKNGKISDVRLGVSQVVNPLYLYFKGSLPLRDTTRLLLRPLLKNIIKVFSPEPSIDRRGRLWGNVLGLKYVLCGRVDPAAILEVEN